MVEYSPAYAQVVNVVVVPGVGAGPVPKAAAEPHPGTVVTKDQVAQPVAEPAELLGTIFQ